MCVVGNPRACQQNINIGSAGVRCGDYVLALFDTPLALFSVSIRMSNEAMTQYGGLQSFLHQCNQRATVATPKKNVHWMKML